MDNNLSKISRIFDMVVTIWDSTDIKTDWKRRLISLNDSEIKKSFIIVGKVINIWNYFYTFAASELNRIG
jgi:hypothetical protein